MPWVREFLKLQQRFVFIGVIIYAFFAALRVPAPFTIIMTAVLCVGNVVGPLQQASRPIYEHRPFPWNWILFFPTVLANGLLTALATTAIVRWVFAGTPSYWAFFNEMAPLMILVSVVLVAGTYLNEQVQGKLREKNLQLAQEVEKGSTALKQKEQELDRALEIQRDLLPKSLPQLPGVDIDGAWQPARTVGGDYYDVIQLDTTRLGFCIGDVSGKGITAALLMANLQASFRAFATPDATPASVCTKLNDFLCGNTGSDKFISFFYGVLDVENLTLTYVNAGHCPVLLMKKTGRAEFLRSEGVVLGIIPEWTYSDALARLSSGDKLVLCTDGVLEAANQQAVEFGEQRLVQSAQGTDGSAQLIQKKIMNDVTLFCLSNFHDDATLLVVAIR
ncbi:MAG TPA: PP2C family protein-serine/threonine phosphatase [Candidatus Acidoferrales bacterium]|nr:PP2C family protein-serine/threonine phosphatase [Candidatus Acidoferrales bacterium]